MPPLLRPPSPRSSSSSSSSSRSSSSSSSSSDWAMALDSNPMPSRSRRGWAPRASTNSRVNRTSRCMGLSA
ncbi:hypothetical protein FA740_09490 [Paracoccus hibiscisoli]|uniref:Uncharacterized protein n=1 Tax=Paracoccus hibiscisoli TaxID=2023261 RepID=A0A4V5MVT2_9RHOB|nr:hypothetical protein FA740_09490 [Paracoccus hibiscisoli]